MTVQNLLETMTERIRSTARIETLYGEPRTVGSQTVIPVAKLRYGFGFGGGTGPGGEGQGEGSGGGAGVAMSPVGFIYLDERSARFVAIRPWRRQVAALLLGFAAGFWLGRRQARRLTQL